MYQIPNIQNTHFYMLSSEVAFFNICTFSLLSQSLIQFIILQSLGFQHPSKVLGI